MLDAADALYPISPPITRTPSPRSTRLAAGRQFEFRSCMAWARPVCGSDPARSPRRALSGLRAGRFARRSLPLPGAASARERRQLRFVNRISTRASRSTSDPRSARNRAAFDTTRTPRTCATGRSVRSQAAADQRTDETIPWASISPTTINCARSPNRSAATATGARRRWCRERRFRAPRSPSPIRRSPRTVGQWQAADAATVERALHNAVARNPSGPHPGNSSRAAILEHPPAAQARMPQYIALCTKEPARPSPMRRRVREAVDFLRYTRRRHASCSRPKPCPPDRRIQHAAAAGSWRVRLHQYVEFSVAIFAGQSCRGATPPAIRDRQARRQTNLIGQPRSAAARGRRAGSGAAVSCPATVPRRRRAPQDARVAGVDLLPSDRTAACDQSRAGRARRPRSAC